MKLNNLRALAIKEIEDKYNRLITKAQKCEQGLKEVLQWEGKAYKKNPYEKLIKHLEKRKAHEISLIEHQINTIESTPEFKGELIITVEWKKSYMWGSNPRAYTNYGFTGESISGCGYDKLSTATAQALNSHAPLLKMLWIKKEQWLKEHYDQEFTEEVKRDHLGYGCGYSVLPRFEGGVGVSSHQNIIKGLGLTMESIADTNSVNVYRVVLDLKGGVY